jgi:hypothetical protein
LQKTTINVRKVTYETTPIKIELQNNLSHITHFIKHLTDVFIKLEP